MADEPEAFMPFVNNVVELTRAKAPTPPAGIPAQDHKPMSTPQYARREALRLAIDCHRATEDEFTPHDALETAHDFAEFIRTGTLPTPRDEEA